MRSYRTTRIRVLVSLLLTGLLAAPASAEVFLVGDTLDAVPAPPGTLRWAIEQSEHNGVPDSIGFLIDGGTITLVAPLPDLAEGGLRIGSRRTAGSPSGGNGIAISGANGVERAFRILSPDNLIAELDFVDFGGAGVIEIDGAYAGNAITGCVFGRDTTPGANAGAAIRIGGPDAPGTPTGTVVRFNRFVNNGTAIALDGDGTAAAPSWTIVSDNWFGTGPTGEPGAGNGTAIRARDGGRLHIARNRFSGPGQGILLGAGSSGSVIADNRVGLRSADGTSCSGPDGDAVRVEDSARVAVVRNTLICGDTGLHLAPGADEARVADNLIGGSAADGMTLDGVLLDPGDGAQVRGNRISGNDGFGIASVAPPVIAPGKGARLECNSLSRNLAGALDLPGVTTSPPVLTSAAAVSVSGDLPDVVAGWVEVFGDDAAQAGVFQGASRVDTASPPFRHLLPVLELTVAKVAGGVEIAFDRKIPAQHTATLTDESLQQTTELSAALSAQSLGVLFDVVRGDLANLALGSGGGITLGPVTCLDSGLTPDPTVAPNPVDPAIPPVGGGFFYVARRRDASADVKGTYDPAICLGEVDAFDGPRLAASGDCP